MEFVVAIQSITLALLCILVVGLLRSHAEILRVVNFDPEADDPPPPPEAIPSSVTESLAGSDIVGTTLGLRPTHVKIPQPGTGTVVAFLSSSCLTCVNFWDALRDRGGEGLPPRTSVVVVTKDRAHEQLSKLRKLAPTSGTTVVMSSAAWDTYQVPGSPYVIYVDGRTGDITGGGAAQTWQAVVNLINDALDEQSVAMSNHRDHPRTTDRVLAAAGITPGHSSLYASLHERDPDSPDELTRGGSKST